MKDDLVLMSLLFDFYGGMLTDKQRELFYLYYNEDLSLGEIAEADGITRQGVRDAIVRAEAVLREAEERLGLLSRFADQQRKVQRIDSLTRELASVNQKTGNNALIRGKAEEILGLTAEILS